jgi:hypothetical protein
MKNIEAPFAWAKRRNQPAFTSRMMPTFTESNAPAADEWKCIASTMPVTSWQTSATPASTPKFHQ